MQQIYCVGCIGGIPLLLVQRNCSQIGDLPLFQGRSRPKFSHAQISFKLLLQLDNDQLISKK